MIRHVQSLESRRLCSTYAIDPTWGDGGTQAGRLNIPSDGPPLIAVRDGRIVAAATYDDEFYGPIDNIRRYHGDGTFDRSFKAIRESDSANLHVAGVDALARPLFEWPGTGKAAMTRYLPRGVNDKAFDGVVTPPNAAGKRVGVSRVEPQPGGTLLGIVGVTTPAKKVKDRVTELYLFRLNEATGQVDSTFGANGYLALGHSVEARDVQLQADGRGRIYLSFAGRSGTYRLRPSGTRDKAFADNGKINKSPDGGFTLDAAGQYLTWRDDGAINYLLRYDTAGRADETFNASVERHIPDGALDPIFLFPQPDGTLYLQFGKNLRRFKADGSDDASFDDDGVAELHSSQPIVAALPAGRFLQVGDTGESVYAIAPAEAVTLGADQWLRINGTAAADEVDVRLDGSNVRVSFNGVVTRFPAKGIQYMLVELDEGNNRFVSTAPFNTTVNAGQGNNLIYTGDGRDFVSTGKRADTIATGRGEDNIFPGGGDNVIDSGRGGGTIGIDANAPAGRNVITGRDGESWRVEFANASSARMRLSGSTAVIDLAGGDNDLSLAMGRFAQVTTGNGKDRIDLRDGGTKTSGEFSAGRNGGDDLINPGGGNDTVFAGPGEDTIADTRPLRAGVPDDDVYVLGGGDDLLSDVVGNNSAAGEAGDDTITFGHGRDTLGGGDGNDRLLGGDGNDSISGGLGADTLYGGAGSDTLVGDDGDDDLFGGTGPDTLRGEAGDDRLYAAEVNTPRTESQPNALFGGSGTDRAQLANDDDVLDSIEQSV